MEGVALISGLWFFYAFISAYQGFISAHIKSFYKDQNTNPFYFLLLAAKPRDRFSRPGSPHATDHASIVAHAVEQLAQATAAVQKMK